MERNGFYSPFGAEDFANAVQLQDEVVYRFLAKRQKKFVESLVQTSALGPLATRVSHQWSTISYSYSPLSLPAVGTREISFQSGCSVLGSPVVFDLRTLTLRRDTSTRPRLVHK